MAERILVIKLGALGDIVLAFGPFAAIRAHHPAAKIILLTTAPFADWLGATPWFDAVRIDARPAWWQLSGLVRLRSQLQEFDLVYDLQTSGRSSKYFWLAGRPPWSGIGRGRRFAHRDPARDSLHSWERQRDQLRVAGIATVPLVRSADLAPLTDRAIRVPPEPYAVLIPGAAAHRPEKCWPVPHYAELAVILRARGLRVVIAGGMADRPAADAITEAAPFATNLAGATSLPQLATWLGGADLVIGNDTGPMHLTAALGARCIVLFGAGSDPALTAPRMPDGTPVTVLRADNLADLPASRVAAALG